MIAVRLLEPNTGQLDWLPRNPRQWTREDVARTAQSIEEDPDFLEDRPLLVVPHGKKWVVFAGNLRREGCLNAGLESVPCVTYQPEDEADQLTIKRRAMKDNGSFGSWDYDELANAWDDLPLEDWGIDVPEMEMEEEDEEVDKKKEKIEEVERLLDEAMRENVKESIEQIEHGLTRGWISTFLTKGLAQAKFIRAKYYGEHYPQWMSLYFCPERLMTTSVNKKSPWEQMNLIAKGETDAGIAGLRTLSGDHLLLLLLLKGSYPFGSARMPMDFPANVARHLIEEFGGTGARVLDPCHGWGGRLCGALMADATLYVGVDPSDEAHAGVEKEAEAFLPYCEGSKVELIKAPYEDTRLDKYGLFDVAITSPPYFDVEQYHGEGQAHIRYPQFEGWVSGFYRPMIEKTYDALKPDGVFCLQVGSKSYPLLSRGVEIAKKTGFTVEDIRPLGGGTESALHNGDAEDEENEKIIILRK